MKVLPDAIRGFGWYGAGYAVCIGGTDDPNFYPPLHDLEAQREWLAGFEAAWCDCPDAEAIDSILFGDGMGGESLEAALTRVLEDRPAPPCCRFSSIVVLTADWRLH